MRIKENFSLRDVCGEKVIIAEGVENIDFSKIISLNDTAAFLWTKALGHDFTHEELAGELQKEYDVEPQTALEDVKNIVNQWKKEGMVD